MPDVSVVIPSYNRAHLIGETLDSVLAQDVPGMEILVVDDGSTDATEAVVLGRYGDRVRYVRQANGGPACARNTGIREASAPLIAFLDSDDLWSPGKLRKQLEMLRRDPSLGLVFTGTQTMD